MYAYAYGNEQSGGASLVKRYLDDLTTVRAALTAAYPDAATRPKLVGPDSGVGPARETSDPPPADCVADDYISSHLDWVGNFTAGCHGVVDAITCVALAAAHRDVGRGRAARHAAVDGDEWRPAAVRGRYPVSM